MSNEVFPRKLADARVGRTLNSKWHLDRLIDVGGMASVYAATHRNGKRVAVKILHPVFPPEMRLKERFLREGYLANKVDHPGTVSVLDDDTTEEGEVFLVMDLLEGVSLETLLQLCGNVLPYPHVLAIVEPVLDVLAAAHAKGIIHRDIKPANLFVTRERVVKVLDFGLARLLETGPGSQLTGVGMVMGTSSYMAPEQARGMWNVVDGRADLFGVGAVMFRSIAGRTVHEAPTARERHIMAMSQPAASLRTAAADIPGNVAALVDKALAFDSADRWHDAATMLAAVRNALIIAPIGDNPLGPKQAKVLDSRLQLPTVVDGGRRVVAVGQQPSVPITYAPSSTDVDSKPPFAADTSLSVDVDIDDPAMTAPLSADDVQRLPEVSACLMDEVLSRCDMIDAVRTDNDPST